jgi:hypothetical protein
MAARRLRASQKTEAPFMETVGVKRRFFASAYEGGASGQFPSIKDRS